MSSPAMTARQQQMVSCHSCHLLLKELVLSKGQSAACPRCGATLHSRKPNSLMRTWALVFAAAILYLPANLLPITITSAVGVTQADTIMSGVIYFLHSGMVPIALVIFIASIFIPMMKLVILTYLLISVQRGSRHRLIDRTRLYRLTELVGRWSMVDVYVVTILVALVKLGAVAQVDAGPATPYFAGVVVITMFAAESFDPRLIWDAMEDDDE